MKKLSNKAKAYAIGFYASAIALLGFGITHNDSKIIKGVFGIDDAVFFGIMGVLIGFAVLLFRLQELKEDEK